MDLHSPLPHNGLPLAPLQQAPTSVVTSVGLVTRWESKRLLLSATSKSGGDYSTRLLLYRTHLFTVFVSCHKTNQLKLWLCTGKVRAMLLVTIVDEVVLQESWHKDLTFPATIHQWRRVLRFRSNIFPHRDKIPPIFQITSTHRGWELRVKISLRNAPM